MADVTVISPPGESVTIVATPPATVEVKYAQQPQANLVPTLSGTTNSYLYPKGPADWVDINNLPPLEQPLPPEFYFDAANKIIAPSQNGAKVAEWKRITLYGSNQGLYSATPILQNGKIRPYYPYMGDYATQNLPAMAANYPNNGPRGVGLFDAYVGLHSHPTLFPAGHPQAGKAIPNSPAFLAIRLDGSMMRYMLDGSIYVLGKVPGTLGPFDFSYFTQAARQIFFVADTHNGRIIRVDRGPAIAAKPPGGTEDGALWAFSDLVKGRGEITSVRCLDDGTLFWAEPNAGQVWRAKMTADGQLDGQPSLLCSLPGAFWIDYTSTQQLVVAARTSALRMVDPVTGAIGPQLGGLAEGTSWPFMTISVDRHGTCGPVDTIYWGTEHGQQNVDLRTFFPPYTASSLYPPYGGGRAKAGPANICDEPAHYVWVREPGWDQAIMLEQGESDGAPSICRPKRASDPVMYPYDHNMYQHGYRFHVCGTVAGPTEGTKPPFSTLMHKYGGGCLGVNHDSIGRMEFAEFDAFLAKGMIGSFPRPEITGYARKALAFMYYYNSLRHQIEGRALIDRLNAYYGNPPLPAAWPALPTYTNIVRARIIGGNIILDCYNDHETGTITMPAGATLKVMIDEGMPNEITVTTFNTVVGGGPYTVPLPPLGPGQHAVSVRATGLPATCSTRTVIF